MKVLLLNPPALNNKIYMKEIGRCGSTSSAEQLWPQTGLAYLASMSDSIGHESEIIDGIAEHKSLKDILDMIKTIRPKLIILNTTTSTFKNDIYVASEIKKHSQEIKIGFVGTHVSNDINNSLKNKGIDFIIVNEPELVLKELLLSFYKDWSLIRGLAYKKNNKIFINEIHEQIKDLDSLPFPARDKLSNHIYKMVLTNNLPFATVVPSRGCPYGCTYCRVGLPWGKSIKKRSVKNVILELKELKSRYNITNVVFMADTFTIDKAWVMDFCTSMIKENLHINWLCNSRIDTIDEEMATHMKKAGNSLISFGVESGNQKILDNAKKGVDISYAKKAVQIAKNAKIRVFCYFIFGLPGETKKTMLQTLDLAKSLDPDFANFHIATPYPGTELYSYAINNGLLVDNDFNNYDQTGNYAVMRTKELNTDQIVKFRKYAMRSFYFNHKRIIRNIKQVKSFHDLVKKSKIAFKIASGQA